MEGLVEEGAELMREDMEDMLRMPGSLEGLNASNTTKWRDTARSVHLLNSSLKRMPGVW
jgi:hypothetical protein